MSRPHASQHDRDAIEDRGLVDDDCTEDMRPEMRNRPAAHQAASEATSPHHEGTSSS